VEDVGRFGRWTSRFRAREDVLLRDTVTTSYHLVRRNEQDAHCVGYYAVTSFLGNSIFFLFLIGSTVTSHGVVSYQLGGRVGQA